MPEPIAVRSLITPHDQTVREVFNAQRSYFIDIYQREYKWTEGNVRTLLDDIEARFQQYPRNRVNPKEIQEHVISDFEPYFLNTYLTNTTAANTSIVDGQQRLTTLLLVLIKLHRVLKDIEADGRYKEHRTFSSKVIEQLILETNDFGEPAHFKIFNENREQAFRALLEGAEIEAADETRRRMRENYRLIGEYFEKFLRTADTIYDVVKLTYYLAYLLDRISIVEIHIERQENVAMIFEVVNDRGLGLKPYEILKGKLIGSLPAAEKEKANAVWTGLQNRYFSTEILNATEKSIDLDVFFRTFFRAKFADSESEYERFEGDYHYEMYRNAKIREYFGEFQSRDLLFKRIVNDIAYFADLYLRLRISYDEEFLIYNKLLAQDQQYMLIVSNVCLRDVEEKEKIRAVARKFDQLHVILRLLGAYESSEFQRLIYPLSRDIRGKSLTEGEVAFDRALVSALEGAEIITEGQHQRAAELFEYERFKGISNKWANFSKYILMRIDRYLAAALDNKPSYASANLRELENRFNRLGTKIYGMHLEHIYTQHPKNKQLFTTDEVFDETRFQQVRNLLGMVLLLKDRHNLSSNDEIYRDKIDTYSKSNLIWNELLIGHLNEIDLEDLPEDMRLEKIEPNPDGVFPLEKTDDRQRAVFAAIKDIWGSF